MKTDIFSLSLGDSRRFLIKNSKERSEYWLKNGDLIHMYGQRIIDQKIIPSCQRMFVHSVPPMSMKDMLCFIKERGYQYNGLKKKNDVLNYMKEHNLTPMRINLTFRQFE